MMNIKQLTKIHYKNQLRIYLHRICLEIYDDHMDDSYQRHINEILTCFDELIEHLFNASVPSKVFYNERKNKIKNIVHRIIMCIDAEHIPRILKVILEMPRNNKLVDPQTIIPFIENMYKEIITSYILSDIIHSLYNTYNAIKKIHNKITSEKVEDKKYLFAMTHDINNQLKSDYGLLLKLYVYILNTFDKNNLYVLPQIMRNNNTIKFLLSIVKRKKDSKLLGGDPSLDRNVETIKDMMIDMGQNKPIIKNVYDIEDIKQIESLLQNSKINDLIQSKRLKLNNNFQSLLHDISRDVLDDYKIKDNDKENGAFDEENDVGEKEKFQSFFNKFFIFSNENDEEKEKLYTAFMNAPNKKVFLDYFVDRYSHNTFLNPDKGSKLLSIADNLFSKILKSDLGNNSFSLNNNDTQFILMLETLESFKTALRGNETNNITININKELNDLKLNNDIITLN